MEALSSQVSSESLPGLGLDDFQSFGLAYLGLGQPIVWSVSSQNPDLAWVPTLLDGLPSLPTPPGTSF